VRSVRAPGRAASSEIGSRPFDLLKDDLYGSRQSILIHISNVVHRTAVKIGDLGVDIGVRTHHRAWTFYKVSSKAPVEEPLHEREVSISGPSMLLQKLV
jgi:hypothetical protein